MKIDELEFLKELIEKKSITPDDGGILDLVREKFSDFQAKRFDLNGVKNLFLWREFYLDSIESKNIESKNIESKTAAHLCFAGHIDVVPSGNEELWDFGAFSAKEFEENGKSAINGRGTQDMKSGVACFCAAVREFADCIGSVESVNQNENNCQEAASAVSHEEEALRRLSVRSENREALKSCSAVGTGAATAFAQCDTNKSGEVIKNSNKKTISILLTSDEEGDAIFGTRYALIELKKLGLLPDFALVAEPTCVKEIGDTIKIGRRGSINGKIAIQGVQGHAAYPSKCVNPVELFAPILAQIAGANLDSQKDGFEPTKLVITDIRGGLEVVNVSPGELKIMFNLRNAPHTSFEKVCEFLENIFKNCGWVGTWENSENTFSIEKSIEFKPKSAKFIAKFSGNFNKDSIKEQNLPQLAQKASLILELKQSSKPFLTSKNDWLCRSLFEAVRKICQIQPQNSTGGGTSDARYLAEFGVSVAELGVCNDRIHAINERVFIDEVRKLKAIFSEVLKDFANL